MFSGSRPIIPSRFAEESAERADVAENQLGKLRAKSRSSVSVSRLSPGVSAALFHTDDF